MDNSQFHDQPQENLIPNEIPSGLKTLCILSFVMCGIMLLMNLLGLRNFVISDSEIEQSYDMMQQFNSGFSMDYDEYANSIRVGAWNNLLTLVLNIGSLVGVILMYKMKKKGFMIYAISEFVPYLTMIFFSGQSSKMFGGDFFKVSGMSMQTLVIISITIMVLIDGLFVFLYSRHLKSLK
jgi:hypothetical protein